MLEYAYAGLPEKGTTLNRDSPSMPTLKTLNTSFNCNFCHDPHSAEPRIVNDFLIETLINPDFKDNAYQKNVGKGAMTRVEIVDMGERGYKRKIAILERYDANFMCGQCHMAGNQSGTFRDKNTNEGIPGVKAFNEPVRFAAPFAEGPFELYEYYKAKNWYTDTHPVTGTKWARPRDHAHVEILIQSKHGKAGVGCTDCHYAKTSEGTMEHQPSLPKEKVQNTCLRSDCHGKGTKFNWLTAPEALYRIEAEQQKARVRVGHWNVAASKAIEYIKDINQGIVTVGEKELEALHEAVAKSLTLEMYWFTDFSMGFHDPDLHDSTVTAVTRELNEARANAKKTEKITAKK
jgi:formate-dependent nitrite reductase cytochrome c552 subunit